MINLISATEKAAIEATKYIGSGKLVELDTDATLAIESILNELDLDLTVCLSEGEKDGSFYLPSGRKLGKGGKHYDLVMDAIDGTKLTAYGLDGAISCLALSEKYTPLTSFYVMKLACGRRLAPYLSLRRSLTSNIKSARIILQRNVTVCLLDRVRNAPFIDLLRKMDVRIKLITDGDIIGCINSCSWEPQISDSGVDIYYGIGGTSEGLLSATAIKLLGGHFECFEVNESWKGTSEIYDETSLLKGESIFIATGVTDSSLLKGVRISKLGYRTHSLVISDKIRHIKTWH